MSDAASLEHAQYCLDDVRRLDHDRFLTVLFAPAPKRMALFALYAFNAEIACVAELVSEPMLGQIRLQWWRETIEALDRREVRSHVVASALALACETASLPSSQLLSLIDARERDLDDAPFPDMTALESYAKGTSAAIMALAAEALGGADAAARAGGAIEHAGIAYALTGILRALPLHASQGRLMLPTDLMAQHGVDPHDIFAGVMSLGLRMIIATIATRARVRLTQARNQMASVTRQVLPALLPVSLCDNYLDIVAAPDFDPFRMRTDVPAFRRQLRLLGRVTLQRY